MSVNFDPTAELALLRERKRASRQRYFKKSQLDQFSYQLLELHNAGASIAELQRWLSNKKVNVHHTTVSRWVRRNNTVGRCDSQRPTQR